MSSIQVREDSNNEPFVLDDTAEVRTDLTLSLNQAALTKGMALGVVGHTDGGGVVGQVIPVAGGATDGSQFPKYLLSDDAVAVNTGATQTVSGYTRGLFDEDQIQFATTATTLTTQITTSTDNALFTSMKDALRDFGIRTAPGISLTGVENAATI